MNTQIDPKLKRYPYHKQELLQAWDAADELILQHVQSVEGEFKGKRILIVGDQFGALSCALRDLDMTVYTDSYLSFRGIQMNSQIEGRAQIQPLHRLEDFSGLYDWVLIKVPKNMSFFEDLLCRLSAHLHLGSKLICGYMVKYQAKASFELLAKYIGETHTSLAQKKARLIFSDFQREKSQSPFPLSVKIEGFDKPFLNHSNLFSREKLDVGTRFLLEHIPQGKYKSILDLGCANGVVGIAAKRSNPSARIIFSDESWMAVQSAKYNYEKIFEDTADFLWTHCFENQKTESIDLVICNPPFHQGNALGDATAWQMFRDAKSALVQGGMIRVIGNTHLKYHLALEQVFGNSRVIAKNSKFMIADAYKA